MKAAQAVDELLTNEIRELNLQRVCVEMRSQPTS